MQTVEIEYELTSLLAADEAARVLPALRQDVLIWQFAQQPGVWDRVARACAVNEDAARHIPGILAALALNLEALALLGEHGGDSALLARAGQVYQNALRSGGTGEKADLPAAATLSLALQERGRAKNWGAVAAEIHSKTGPDGALPQLWRTALACLVGMLADPEELLRALLPRQGSRQSFEWLSHAALCQSWGMAQQVERFCLLLKEQPLDTQAGVLRSLKLHGRGELAATIARSLLTDHPSLALLRSQSGILRLDLAAIASRAFLLQHLAALYQIAGDTIQAQSLLRSAEGTLKHWMAGLYLQEMNLTLSRESARLDELPEEGRLEAILCEGRRFEAELGGLLANFPLRTLWVQRVGCGLNDSLDPLLQMQQAARLAEQGETALARDLACQASGRLVERVAQTGLPFWGDFVYEWQPKRIVDLLLELELQREALALIRALLAARPGDLELLEQAANISALSGDVGDARRLAQFAVGLQPNAAAWRSRLGRLWMDAGEWHKAMSELEQAVRLAEQPAVADRLMLAQAALMTGRRERVVEICQVILQQEPDNGTAAGLMGMALLEQGQAEHAMPYLVRATICTPADPAPWLASVDILRGRGELMRAVETLRSAIGAIPASAPELWQVFLALGEVYCELGQLAEALPALKGASALNPESAQAAYLYAKTLRALERPVDARAALEGTRKMWQTRPDMAYEYARACQELHDLEGMLVALEVALHAPKELGSAALPEMIPIEWYLLYACALLGELPGFERPRAISDKLRLHRAEQAVKQVLARYPVHYEARFLLALILYERGEDGAALTMFRALAEVHTTPVQALFWRVQWGLGSTALRLGQVDAALAALKEACDYHPDDLDLQHDLAETCRRADLGQEALAAAQYALQLAPDQVENLVWFARFVTRFGENKAALDALESAVQLEPARPDLRVQLAEWRLRSGDEPAARKHLQALAGLEMVAANELRLAASLYLKLGDVAAALDALLRVASIERNAPPALFIEIAGLQVRLGQHESALQTMQNVLRAPLRGEPQEYVTGYVLQADLLERLERHEMALESLDMALRLLPLEGQDNPLRGEIHTRFSRLLVKTGRLSEALSHAERALELLPERFDLRSQVVRLALLTLQIKKAEQLARSTADELDATAEDAADVLEWLSLKAEVGLELEGSTLSPSSWVEQTVNHGLFRDPGHPRLLAARVRCLARQGDWLAAGEVYTDLCDSLQHEDEAARSAYWLADTALEMQRWEEALDLYGRYCQLHVHEARGHLALARAMVLCAERRLLCDLLDCREHTPPPTALADENRVHFEQALQVVERLVGQEPAANEVLRYWKVRGQAVFSPTLQAVRELIALPPCEWGTMTAGEISAAMVIVLRRLGRHSAAVQAGQRSPDDNGVRLQVALCYLEEQRPLEGLPLARELVEADAENPLLHVLLARLYQQAGENAPALISYENALRRWPGEAGWHDAAGDLANSLNDHLSLMLHREQALALDTGNAEFALKLGEVCLDCEGNARSVEVLEMASRLSPERSAVWLTLAKAYRQAGRLPQAIEAALHAGQIDVLSGAGYLMAAQTALAMENTGQAIDFARNAARREPHNPEPLLFLSKALTMADKSEEALQLLEQSPCEVRGTFAVAFEIARLMCAMQGPKAALESLERLVTAYPDEAELLAFTAFAHAQCDNPRAAERHGFKALRLNPNQPELARWLGQMQLRAGQLDQAVHLLSEAVRLSPGRLESYLSLGSAYQARRELAQALHVYRQAMRVAPSDHQAYYQSGLILRDSKDYAGAEAMLRRAADLCPENSAIRRQLVAVIALNLVHNKKEGAT